MSVEQQMNMSEMTDFLNSLSLPGNRVAAWLSALATGDMIRRTIKGQVLIISKSPSARIYLVHLK